MAQLNFGPLQQLQQQIAQPQVTPISAFQGARDQRRQRSLADMQLQQNKFKLDELGRQKKMQDDLAVLGDPARAAEHDSVAQRLGANLSIDDRVKLKQLAQADLETAYTEMLAEPDPKKRGDIWLKSASHPYTRYEFSKRYDGEGVSNDDLERIGVSLGKLKPTEYDFETFGDGLYRTNNRGGAEYLGNAAKMTTQQRNLQMLQQMGENHPDYEKLALSAGFVPKPPGPSWKITTDENSPTGHSWQDVNADDPSATLVTGAIPTGMNFEWSSDKDGNQSIVMGSGAAGTTVAQRGKIQEAIRQGDHTIREVKRFMEEFEAGEFQVSAKDIGRVGGALQAINSFVKQATDGTVDLGLVPVAERQKLVTRFQNLTSMLKGPLLNEAGKITDPDRELLVKASGSILHKDADLEQIMPAMEEVLAIAERTQLRNKQYLYEGFRNKPISELTPEEAALALEMRERGEL